MPSMLKKIQTILRREGLSAVPRRAWAKLMRGLASSHEEVRARRKSSYRLNANSDPLQLNPRLDKAALVGLSVEKCILQQVAQHYLDHRFDLLGSGWVQVHRGMHCRGMAGYRYDMADLVEVDGNGHWLEGRLNASNLPVAQRIWQRVDPNYVPIDWQLDFKSGYRWSEATWAARLRYGHLLGVDVKVPWELARMQHLPQMALRAGALGVNDEEAQRLVREVRNQWLDFISTNPPGFGVNWRCPMDIAIRGANWCLTWDILRAAGFSLDQEDTTILAHSLYDHGSYIVRNLEWSNERANHYLANICGLTFIAAYLPETQETDRWLAFSIGQLQTETLRQFLPDGGNFEGSTAYHRLSLEMVLYATALILGLPEAKLARLTAINPGEYRYLPKGAGVPKQWTLHETGKTGQGALRATPFKTDFVERLLRAVDFFAAILKPDGTFPQIGDNDSGRFFKLQPLYSVMTVGEAKRKYLNLEGYDELSEVALYFFEEGLNGGHLLAAGDGLGFKVIHSYKEITRPTDDVSIDRVMSSAIAKRKVINCSKELLFDADKVDKNEAYRAEFQNYWNSIKERDRVKLRSYSLQGNSAAHRQDVVLFEHFGCILFKSPGVYLIIRCVVQPNVNLGGHGHYDQLSMELVIEGEPVLRDPGSFIYTALPAERHLYQSPKAHSPILECACEEPRNTGIFDSVYLHPAKLIFCGPYGLAAHQYIAGVNVQMLVRFRQDAIEVMYTDSFNTIHDNRNNKLPMCYSPGYGIKEKGVA